MIAEARQSLAGLDISIPVALQPDVDGSGVNLGPELSRVWAGALEVYNWSDNAQLGRAFSFIAAFFSNGLSSAVGDLFRGGFDFFTGVADDDFERSFAGGLETLVSGLQIAEIRRALDRGGFRGGLTAAFSTALSDAIGDAVEDALGAVDVSDSGQRIGGAIAEAISFGILNTAGAGGRESTAIDLVAGLLLLLKDGLRLVTRGAIFPIVLGSGFISRVVGVIGSGLAGAGAGLTDGISGLIRNALGQAGSATTGRGVWHCGRHCQRDQHRRRLAGGRAAEQRGWRDWSLRRSRIAGDGWIGGWFWRGGRRGSGGRCGHWRGDCRRVGAAGRI